MNEDTPQGENKSARNRVKKDSNSPEPPAGMYINSRILIRSQRQSAKLADCGDDEDRRPGVDPSIWKGREEKILRRIQDSIEWYRIHSDINRIMHFVTSSIIMVGGIIAPVLITYGNGGGGSVKVMSIIVTILIGFSEGARRLFNFHDKWRSFYMSRRELIRIREAYRDLTATMAHGSCKWVKVYLDLRDDYFDLTMSETRNFFSSQSSGQDKPGKNTGS